MAVSPGALLHLRYVGIKLPPAGFLSLRRVKKPTQITERFWKSSSVSSGPLWCAKSSIPQLLFFFCGSPGHRNMPGPALCSFRCIWHCIDLCAKAHLIRSFYLCLPVCLQSICFFLGHEVQVTVSATIMSNRTHGANDVRSHSPWLTRIWTASGDSWRCLKFGQIFKWYSIKIHVKTAFMPFPVQHSL